ncbi:MAG: hypothetical protein LBJ75_04550 [Puniceicoccales bacterium]|jgi:hypothetical protein|nr:hypothetical protein [Puniceicoccales bacterium]
MSDAIPDANSLREVSQPTEQSEGASFGPHTMGLGPGEGEPSHSERQSGTTLAKHAAAVACNPTLCDDIDNVLIQAQIPTGLGRGDFLRLRNCTIEQQALIIQYAVDMICGGNEPEQTAQICANMVILCQGKLRNPLAGCSPEQQAFIIQHGMDMIGHGLDTSSAAQACAQITLLCQGKLRNPLAGCFPEQQAFIIQHGMDMICHGLDTTSAAQACAQITVLCQGELGGLLAGCSPEQQAFIIQHGMNMISRGLDTTSAAQACEQITVLCQGELGGLLAGCTPEQQALIIQHGMDMIGHGLDPTSAAQACAQITVLCQGELRNPLAGCTPEQQGHIIRYGMDMIGDNYSLSYVKDVGKGMVEMYQKRIGNIFSQISITSEEESLAVAQLTHEAATLRAQATEILTGIMSEHGTNYAIVADWLFSHQRMGPNSNGDKAMKYFLFQQLANQDEASLNDNFYFSKESVSDLQESYERFFEKLICGEDKISFTGKQYYDAMVLYRAFTAVGLLEANYIGKVPNGDNNFEIEVRRSIQYPPNHSVHGHRQGDVFEDKHGIVDSAALISPRHKWRTPLYTVLKFTTPISRIHAAYFLSQQLCCEGLLSERKSPNNIPPDKLRLEREFVAHLGGSPKIIIDKPAALTIDTRFGQFSVKDIESDEMNCFWESVSRFVSEGPKFPHASVRDRVKKFLKNKGKKAIEKLVPSFKTPDKSQWGTVPEYGGEAEAKLAALAYERRVFIFYRNSHMQGFNAEGEEINMDQPDLQINTKKPDMDIVLYFDLDPGGSPQKGYIRALEFAQAAAEDIQ